MESVNKRELLNPLSLSRPADTPVQLIQLLQALNQQDGNLPGWPHFSPLKVQMQKCEKCSRQFCSPINYRRHVRMHRRTLNLDKDSARTREFLGAFWDKLSLDKAAEVLSFDDVVLEEVTGQSIVKALVSFIRKPGFPSLPQAYVKAGSYLLDIIQSTPSQCPLSSRDLFSILDDASECTFLCAGTADAIRKHIFDGEAGKIGLEVKNLVACTSFLVEQKLVKAWVAEKDAEALRSQKLLVEEEEAAQRRQTEALERKRKKKLRQKEQRAKQQINVDKDVSEGETGCPEYSHAAVTQVKRPPSPPPSESLATQSDQLPSSLEPIEIANVRQDEAVEIQPEQAGDMDLLAFDNDKPNVSGKRGHHNKAAAWGQESKLHKVVPNGFHKVQQPKIQKHGNAPRHPNLRDQKVSPSGSDNRVWTQKPKSKTSKATENGEVRKNGTEIVIGSMLAPHVKRSGRQLQEYPRESDSSAHDCTVPKKIEKPAAMKLWRPVSRNGASCVLDKTDRAESDANNEIGEPEVGIIGGGHKVTGNGHNGDIEVVTESVSLDEENDNQNGFIFSSEAAEAFLTRRYKEAIAGEHVELVLLSKSNLTKNQKGATGNSRIVSSSASVAAKTKHKTMYIPKQKV